VSFARAGPANSATPTAPVSANLANDPTWSERGSHLRRTTRMARTSRANSFVRNAANQGGHRSRRHFGRHCAISATLRPGLNILKGNSYSRFAARRRSRASFQSESDQVAARNRRTVWLNPFRSAMHRCRSQRRRHLARNSRAGTGPEHPSGVDDSAKAASSVLLLNAYSIPRQESPRLQACKCTLVLNARSSR